MNVEAYHGTNAIFSEFKQSEARNANDLYGGGIAYFTDTLDVAKSYAKTMTKLRGGNTPMVYKVKLRLNKTFDVDAMYSDDLLLKMIGGNVEQFARAAGLLKLGTDRIKVLSNLKSGNMKLRGDIVFKGMSNGMVTTSVARHRLDSLGFDSLRYNGGENMNVARHNVYLVYRARCIEVENRYIVAHKPLSLQEKKEVYSFI